MFKSHKTSALIRAIVIAVSTSLTLAACGGSSGGTGSSSAPALNTNKQATSVNSAGSSKPAPATSTNSSSSGTATSTPSNPPATSEDNKSSTDLTLNTNNSSSAATKPNSSGSTATTNNSSTSSTTNVTLPQEDDEEISANVGGSANSSSNGNKVSQPISAPTKPTEPSPAPQGSSTPTQVKPAEGGATPTEPSAEQAAPTTPSHASTDLTLTPAPEPEGEVVSAPSEQPRDEASDNGAIAARELVMGNHPAPQDDKLGASEETSETTEKQEETASAANLEVEQPAEAPATTPETAESPAHSEQPAVETVVNQAGNKPATDITLPETTTPPALAETSPKVDVEPAPLEENSQDSAVANNTDTATEQPSKVGEDHPVVEQDKGSADTNLTLEATETPKTEATNSSAPEEVTTEANDATSPTDAESPEHSSDLTITQPSVTPAPAVPVESTSEHSTSEVVQAEPVPALEPADTTSAQPEVVESDSSASEPSTPTLVPQSASDLLTVNNSSASNKAPAPPVVSEPTLSAPAQPARLTISKKEFAENVNKFTGVKEVGIENYLGKETYAVAELQAVTESALRQRAKLEHLDGVAATDFTLKETTNIGHQRVDAAYAAAVTGHDVNFVKSLASVADVGYAVPFVASGRSLTNATTDANGFITDPQSPLFKLVSDEVGKVAVIDFGPQFTGAGKNRVEYAFTEPDPNNKNNAPYLSNVTTKTASQYVATHGDWVLWRLQAGDVTNTVPGLLRDHGKIRYLGGNQANYTGYYLDSTLQGLGKGWVLDKAINDGYRILNMSFGTPIDPVKLGDYLKSKGDNTVAHALWLQRLWGWATKKTVEGEFLSSLRQIKFTEKVDKDRYTYAQYNARSYINTLEELTKRDVLAVYAIGNKSDAFDLLSLYLALDRDRYPNAIKGTLYATAYDGSYKPWTPTTCHELRDLCVAAPSYVTYKYSADTIQAFNTARLNANLNPEVYGTSFSAPYVSSVAALVRSVFPWMSNHNLQQTILTTAKDIGAKGIDSRYGWGLIQPQDAVNGPKLFQFADRPFVADLDHNSDLKIVGNNKRFYFYNSISGRGGLEVRGGKTANNALVLASTNNYTGTTKVTNQGFLALDGNLVTSDVVVDGNSRFQGRGLIKSLNVQGAEIVAYNYPQGSKLDQLVRVNVGATGRDIYTREFTHEGFSYANSLVVYNGLTLDKNSTTRIYLGQPVLVGKMATLNNSTLQVDGIARMILTPGSVAYGEVLFAADGIEGTFGKVNFTSPLLTHDVVNGKEQVGFSKVDHRGNQVAGNTRVPQTYWLRVKYNGVVSSLPRITSANDAQRSKIAVGAQNLDTITVGLAQVQGANTVTSGSTASTSSNASNAPSATLRPSWAEQDHRDVFAQLEPLVSTAQQEAENFHLDIADAESEAAYEAALAEANAAAMGAEVADSATTPTASATVTSTTSSLSLAQADGVATTPASGVVFEGMANPSNGTPVVSQPTSSATLVSQELGNLAGLNREQVRELAIGFAGSEFVAARNHHNLITTATLRTQVDHAVAKVVTANEGLTLNFDTNYAQTSDLTQLQQNHLQLAYKSGDSLVTLHFTKGQGSWKSEIMTKTASSDNLGVAVGYQQRIPTLGGWAGVFGTYQQVQDEFSRRLSLADHAYNFNHKLTEENYGVGVSYADYKVFTPGHRLGLYGAVLGLNTQVGNTSETFGNLRTDVTAQQDLSLFIMSGVNYELHNLFNRGLNLNTAYGIVVAHQDNQFQDLQLQLLDNGKVTATVARNLAFSDDLTQNKVKVYHTGSMTLSKTFGAWKVGATFELQQAKELNKKAQLNVEYSF